MTYLRGVLMVAGVLAINAPAGAQSAVDMRAMDRDRDGVVTRAEWRGSPEEFRRVDLNRDGVLSGDEVVEAPSPGVLRRFTNWTAQAFTSLDRNRDRRITRAEWRYDRESFRAADVNHDNILSRPEFLAGGRVADEDRYWDFDANGDGFIEPYEWYEAPGTFRSLDRNRDDRVSRDEFRSGARVEAPAPAARSAAYQAGYERGQAEGRSAGREDRDRQQGFDLDGQRELETADSGYVSRMGPKPEYQAGYREGFRAGYNTGWERR